MSGNKRPRIMMSKAALAIFRKSAALNRRVLTGRIHTFKRLGEPLVFVSASGSMPTVTLPQIVSGSASLALANASSDHLSNTIQFGGALKFMLTQVANPGEIKALFDNYRIKKVQLTVSISASGGSMADNALLSQSPTIQTTANPLIHYTQDNDDADVPNNRTEVLQNSYCKSRRMDGSLFSVVVYPRFQGAVGVNTTGTIAAGGLAPRGMWLDTKDGTDAIQHFGLKFWINNWYQNPSFGNQFSVTITPTYFIECKNVV